MDRPRASKGELLKTTHFGYNTASKCTWKLSLDLEMYQGMQTLL